jgi:hypothetical protein
VICENTAHRGLADMDQAQPRPAVGELAVGPVDATPGLEQLHDRLAFGVEKTVDGATAGGLVDQTLEPVLAAAALPRRRPVLVEVQQPARPPLRPPGAGRVVDQVEQAGLYLGGDPGRDRAGTQSQRAFPSCRCSATACSVIVARSRSTSASSSATRCCSADWPRRPGTEAASASNAPCFAVRHTVTTVDRSTLYRLAASLWVACPVSTETHNSYFSLGGRCRFGLRATGPAPLVLLIFGFDTCTDLPVAQARRQPVG